MAEQAIFKRAEKPERRRNRVKYFAFQVVGDDCDGGMYRCPSVAPWPMSKEQLLDWGGRADITITFIDARPEDGKQA